MIKTINSVLIEYNISYGDLVLMSYIQTKDTELLEYISMFDKRENTYIYDRVNFDNVNHLITNGYVVGTTEKQQKDYLNSPSNQIKDVDKHLKLTSKGKTLLQKFTNSCEAIKTITAKLDIYDKFSQYWYTENGVAHSAAALGEEVKYKAALSEFIANGKYTEEEILKAVYLYFEEFKRRNNKENGDESTITWSFLANRIDFIKGNKASKLTTYCEMAKSAKLTAVGKDITISY